MQCEIQLYILVTMAILSHCFVKKSQIIFKEQLCFKLTLISTHVYKNTPL